MILIKIILHWVLQHLYLPTFRYFEDFKKKIPRNEIEDIEKLIRTQLKEVDRLIQLTICGSYRRGKQESGDIDCLITHPNFTSKSKKCDILKIIINTLKNCGFITETLSLGETKFMVR